MSKYTEDDYDRAKRELRTIGDKMGKSTSPALEKPYAEAFARYRAISNDLGGREHVMGIKGQK
jgi:hypothetical protein